MQNSLRQIQTSRLRWVHIVAPGESEIQHLRENYEFHPLDLQDCVTANQRPKLDVYGEYIFLILLFPYYNRKDREILGTEIDFFIGPDYLITVGDGRNEHALDTFFSECLKSAVLRDRYLMHSPAFLLYEILHRLQESIFPMLDHVSQDITNIERQIFANAERRMVHDILLIKRNIVNFRSIMNAHKSTFKKLTDHHEHQTLSAWNDFKNYYTNLFERTKDIWEILEIQKETINAFQETNDSLISFKLNDILKVLTGISVSIFAATLTAGIFSMRAEHMPFIGMAYDFWIILGIMLLVITSIIAHFKRRGWL